MFWCTEHALMDLAAAVTIKIIANIPLSQM
jgi:hypothetical protein